MRCPAVFLCFVALAGLVMVLPGGLAEGAENAVALDSWALWTGDTMLRGANIYQRRVYPELDGDEFMGSGLFGPPYSQADFDGLAAFGANFVNISCSGLFSETPPFDLDLQAEANLDALLDMAAQAGLFGVISFRTGPGRSDFSVCCYGDDWYDPATYLNDSVWTDAAAQDAWVAMWRHTAERYAANAVVVGYDLMVEPNSNEVLFDEWDPETFYALHGDGLADWNQLYPRIIEAIRQVDERTPILVQPMGYGAVDWLPYMRTVSDGRTIYTVHQYEPFVYTHQGAPFPNSYPGSFDTDEDGVPESVDRNWLDSLLGTVDQFMSQHGVRCAVNEMGVMRWAPGAEHYLSDEISLLEERGLNWAVWAWEPDWAPWAEEVTDFNFRFGPDPANHEDVPGNALETVLKTAWEANTIRPTDQEPGPALLIPAAANLPGLHGTRWRTELEFKAVGQEAALVSIALLERDRENPNPRTATVSLNAGQAMRFENALDDLFSFEGAAALRLTPLSGEILATSRTFTGQISAGTFGQYVPAIPLSEATEFGESSELIQLSGSSGATGFRTNIGLVNTTTGSMEVNIEVFAADGSFLGAIPVTLRALEYRQLGQVLTGIINLEVGDAWARLRTSTPGGAFLAYASVVDNASGDAILIPALASR